MAGLILEHREQGVKASNEDGVGVLGKLHPARIILASCVPEVHSGLRWFVPGTIVIFLSKR